MVIIVKQRNSNNVSVIKQHLGLWRYDTDVENPNVHVFLGGNAAAVIYGVPEQDCTSLIQGAVQNPEVVEVTCDSIDWYPEH
jgi:MinD superfamily P-loop ATPase